MVSGIANYHARNKWDNWSDRNDRWYDRVAAERGGDRVFGRFEARVSSSQRLGGSWLANAHGLVPQDLAFLVSTSDLGLLEYRHGRFFTVVPGHTFGITELPAQQGIVGYQVTGRHGRIVLATSEDPASGEVHRTIGRTMSTLVWGLTRGVHQIRAREDDLLVSDTYRNRLILFSIKDLLEASGRHGQGWRRATRAVSHPTGPLKRGQGSSNYGHFNSILACPDGSWLVMAHNDTLKTGRPSLIYALDRQLQVTSVLETGGSECHDLVRDANGRLMFCRSAEGTLAVDGVDVLAVPQFTRGLAAGPDLVLLGGSPRGDRSSRRTGTAVIYVLDGEYRPCGRLALAGTQIHDLRLLPASDPQKRLTRRQPPRVRYTDAARHPVICSILFRPRSTASALGSHP